MLDTIKVGIPLTQSQHKRIQSIASQADRWQWIQCNQATGELRFRQFSGLAATDGYSYHRELRWDIPVSYFSDCRLLLEFSVPKFWYGHNIHLLYDFVGAIQALKEVLERQFGLKGRGKLPDVMSWSVLRADFCYAWRFPNQQMAQGFLDSLKRFHFPRKKPVIRPESLFFQGNTYSVKVYLKLPEFRAHDRKELLKGKAALEWVNYCEALADGVLRFEATLRYRYLKRQGIKTIGDLAQASFSLQWLEGEQPEDEGVRAAAMFAVIGHHLHTKGIDLNSVLSGQLPDEENQHSLYDGLTISAPSIKLEFNERPFKFEPQTIVFKKRDNPTVILQYFLTKLIGENPSMMQVDQVKSKLLEVYKPVKAARLVSFWLYIQRFGSAEAKEVFGKNSYYVAKSDMKKAGVTLFEPPSGDNVTILEADFLRRFRMQIPSEDVANKFDDYRESANVLNFVPKVSNS
jgi:hypothetical protein